MFGLRSSSVSFHKGLFKDTLPKFYQKYSGSTMAISVLRIDANWYDAHQDALYYMYEFVPVGGYVIFDDVLLLPKAYRAWRELRLLLVSARRSEVWGWGLRFVRLRFVMVLDCINFRVLKVNFGKVNFGLLSRGARSFTCELKLRRRLQVHLSPRS